MFIRTQPSTRCYEDPPGGGGAGAGGGDPAPIVVPLEMLPEDLRGNASVTKFAKDGKVDVSNSLKSYIELEKRLGNSIRIPGAEATAEEKDAFRKQLGVPGAPADYGIQAGSDNEIDKSMVDGFLKTAHDAGLTKGQAEVLYGWWGEFSEQVQAKSGEKVKEIETKLKNQYGDDFDRVTRDAKKTFYQFGSETLKARIDAGDPIGNDMDLIETFIAVSKGMSEGRFVQGDLILNTASNIQARIDQIVSDPAYMDPSNPKHRALHEEREGLYRKLYPGKK